jgi:hypothetical protein
VVVALSTVHTPEDVAVGTRLAQAFGVVLAVITAEESSAVACRQLNDLGISGTSVKRAKTAPAALGTPGQHWARRVRTVTDQKDNDATQ